MTPRQLPDGHPVRKRIRAARTDQGLWVALIAILAAAVLAGIYALRNTNPVYLWQGIGIGSFAWITVRLIVPQIQTLNRSIASMERAARGEALRIDGGTHE